MLVREHQDQFRLAQADVNQYYGVSNSTSRFVWNKPVGTSIFYAMLVGGGGAGDNTNGGGCGAVTVLFAPIRSIADSIMVEINATTTNLYVNSGTSTTRNLLLSAKAANTTTAGGTTAIDGYSAVGFYESTAGISGGTTSTAPTTTFLTPGASASVTNGVYNYKTSTNGSGYFMISPIPVGVSGASSASAANISAYGCGSFSQHIARTPGMAIIASW